MKTLTFNTRKIFRSNVMLIVLFIVQVSVFAQEVVTEPYITMTKEIQQKMTPQEALQKLKDGNNRFVSGHELKRDLPAQMEAGANGQYPYAVVLSCIDSRTSTEIIFDQGIGDVFNARIAGNYANKDIIGSMEFACKLAGAKLILVVGHSKCGAVKGACDHAELGNLTHVINQIRPAVDSIKNIPGERNSQNERFVEAVARENVRQTIENIRRDSPILREMEQNGQIIVAGAMHNITTGEVEFF
jgi:carbonic anhydrase